MGRYRQAPLPDLPPFSGGAVGYFGYDLVRTVEPLGEPNPDVLGLPDMALMLSDVLVVFDHLKHTITILVNVYAEDRGADVDASYAAARETIAQAKALLAGPLPATATPTPARARPEFTSNMPREQFEAMVARIVEYVHAGDAFQVVPSQRWSADLDADPFSIYRGLRVVNPSPYMYFLDFRDFQIAGAEPGAAAHRVRPPRVDPADRRHAPARRRPGRGREDRRGPARRREGARRARHARRPRAQRPRPRLRVRHGPASTRSWPSRPTRT